MFAIDSGTVAQWFTVAIAAIGLCLGVLAYRRDRYERISETARRVQVSYLDDRSLHIRNDGPTPIRDLRVSVFDLVLDYEPGHVRGWKMIDHLQPGDVVDVRPDFDPGERLPRVTAYAREFAFTDADGRRWHRDWREKLTRQR